MLTDSACVLDVIIRSSKKAKSRVTIDLPAAKQAYDNRDIDDIGRIKTTDKIADRFTKNGKNKSLQVLLDTGILHQNGSQWIVRIQKITGAALDKKIKK